MSLLCEEYHRKELERATRLLQSHLSAGFKKKTSKYQKDIQTHTKCLVEIQQLKKK